MSTYQFGCVSTATTTYGLVQSFTVTNTVSTATAVDEDGNTADFTNYEEIKTCSCEFIYDTAQTKPSAGDEMTITGDDAGKFNITSVTDAESNSGYRRLTIEGTRYVTNSLPAA